MAIQITEDDVTFGISNTRDEQGTVTRLFHVDIDKVNGRMDIPLSDKNFRYLRKVFSSLEIEEYNEG